MSGLVTDLPIWGECPFRDQVPDHIEIRRGDYYGRDTLIFWNPRAQHHVDVHLVVWWVEDSAFDWSRIWKPAVAEMSTEQRTIPGDPDGIDKFSDSRAGR